MEERRARIVVVMVVVGVLVGGSAAAWGQVMDPDSGWAGQPTERPALRRTRVTVEFSGQVEDLDRRRETLIDRARQRQRELLELEQERIARQRALRAQLSDIHGELALVEAELVAIEQRRAEARQRELARLEDEAAILAQRLRELQAQAEQTRRLLAEFRARDAEEGRTLRESLAVTREQMLRLEIELSRPVPEPVAPPVIIEEAPPRRYIEPRYEPLPPPAPRGGEIIIERSAAACPVDGRVRTPGVIGSAAYGYGWVPDYGCYWLY